MTAWAYADPPYLGQCVRYGHAHYGGCWDDLDTHRALVDQLGAFDGWALSLSSPSLAALLPLMPPRARVLAWCKRWSAARPGVSPVYAWEPVVMVGARSRRWRAGVRTISNDWLIADPDARGRDFLGRKPDAFAYWLLDCLGVEPGDTFADLFPGSGAVGRAFDAYQSQLRAFG